MTRRFRTSTLLLSAAAGALLSAGAHANPQGGQVSAGSATITQTSPSRVDVRQTSDRAVIDWRSFSIAPGELTNFQQPGTTAIILNRVNGGDPSRILGKLTANGQVVLVNPSGILFGAGAQVDVGGLIATTTNISNANFMAGRMTFDMPSGSPNATVVNHGMISVQEGGLVALVAPGVANHGVINARLGKVSLVSANSFTVDLYGDRLISIAVDDAVARKMIGPDGQPLAAAVENTGRIVADGGTVQISAKAAKGLLDNAINMSGVVQARSVSQVAGEIVLDGGPLGVVNVAGTLDARGIGAGETGGRVTVLGEKIGVTAGATVDASGAAGGGTVQIGGSQQGQGPLPNASAVYVDAQATIAADATDRGNGGKVIVWSDTYTRFDGTARARGGTSGGDGGFVETSSKGTLVATGRGDVAAPQSKAGTWLLDPYDVTITNATANGAFSGDTFTPSATGSTVSAASINAQLNAGSNVRIQTNTGGGGATGAITVAAAIDKSAGADSTLFLTATNAGITIAAPITNSGGGRLGLNLAGQNVAGNAGVSIRGDLVVTAGGSVTQTAALTVGGNITISTGGAITLGQPGNALGGAISLTTTGNSSVQLTNSGTTTLGGSTIGGNLTVTAGGAITQSAALTVGGTSAFSTTSAGAITLTQSSNAFGGAISLTTAGSSGVQLANTGTTIFATSSIGGSLTVTSGGSITNTGTVLVGGITTAQTNGAPVTLTVNGNQTVASGTVGAVSSPAAVAPIRSSGSVATQSVNGGPFGATGSDGAMATARAVQVGVNGARDAVRTAGIVGTVLPKSAGGSGQIVLESSGPSDPAP